MRNHKETKLAFAVKTHLESAFPFPIVLYTCIANEGRSQIEGSKFKKMGVLAGFADYIFLWNGGWGCIELKAPDGNIQSNQITFEAKVKKINGHHAYCRSLQSVHDTLKSWGLKPLHNAVQEPELRTKQEMIEFILKNRM